MNCLELAAENNLLFYGLTPPKAHLPHERLETLAAVQRTRIEALAPAGLVLYDIQDESQRVQTARPFPFLQTWAPERYASDWLCPAVPTIIYHSISGENAASFSNWLRQFKQQALVLVGAPSSCQQGALGLQEAYRIRQEIVPEMTLGGIVIPERHQRKGNEHLRAWEKMKAGCSFFISQCVYSSESTRNFLSDYYWHLKLHNEEPVPVIFTLTPCGSAQTLRFMQWLGIAVPDWVQNELLFSDNMLEKSVSICRQIAADLITFCREHGLPFGFNIESVSVRKEEIEASVALYASVRALLSGVAVEQRQGSRIA